MRYPLVALVEASGLSETALARRVGWSGTTLRGVRDGGLTERMADRSAVRLGLVPWLIWPTWLIDAEVDCANDRCDRRFVPVVGHQRFCRAACRNSFNERRGRREGLPFVTRKAEYRRRYYLENGDYERRRQRAYDQRRRTA